MFKPEVRQYKWLFDLNPFTHLAVSYQEILFFNGPIGHWRWLLALGVASLLLFVAGLLAVRPAARFLRRGGMTAAIELANVSKIYRRYGGKQFATLKSALLQRSLLRDLRPSETFPALTDVSFQRAQRLDVRGHRTERLWEEHGAQAGGRHHEADGGQRAG